MYIRPIWTFHDTIASKYNVLCRPVITHKCTSSSKSLNSFVDSNKLEECGKVNILLSWILNVTCSSLCGDFRVFCYSHFLCEKWTSEMLLFNHCTHHMWKKSIFKNPHIFENNGFSSFWSKINFSVSLSESIYALH